MATTTTTTHTHSITLQPGESFTLPPNSSLIFVSDSNSVTTDCASIPETEYVCGYFAYARDDDDNDTHPFDEDHLLINKIYVGDTVYTIGLNGANPVTADINAQIPDQAVFTITNTNTFSDLGKRKYNAIYFQVIDSLFDTLELEIVERADAVAEDRLLAYFKPISIDCGVYLETAT